MKRSPLKIKITSEPTRVEKYGCYQFFAKLEKDSIVFVELKGAFHYLKKDDTITLGYYDVKLVCYYGSERKAPAILASEITSHEPSPTHTRNLRSKKRPDLAA